MAKEKNDNYVTKTYSLTRSESSREYIEDVMFDVLFNKVKVEFIMDLFESLLIERRIIFVAKDVGTLSACVNAVYAMIYPFVWQHVFIPILPKKLMDYCSAPMPFLIGIPASSIPLLETLPLEEVVLLELDAGKFLIYPPKTQPILPSGERGRLQKTLTRLKRSNLERAHLNKEIPLAFLQFFAEIFVDYPKYINPEDHKFQMDKYLCSSDISNDVKKFLHIFKGSQMFSVWRRSREEMSQEGTLNQCILLNTPIKGVLHKRISKSFRKLSAFAKPQTLPDNNGR